MLEQRASRTRFNGRIQAVEGVNCPSCGSTNLGKFEGEISIHVAGLEDLDRSPAWVFPKVAICLDCGNAQFTVPEAELRLLAELDHLRVT